MTTKHRCILIDPASLIVQTIDLIKDGDVPEVIQIQKLIGCDEFVAITLGDGDVAFVDGMGRYKDLKYFMAMWHEFPIAGRCLIVGADDNGDTKDCDADVLEVYDSIQWELPRKRPDQLRFVPHSERHRALNLTAE